MQALATTKRELKLSFIPDSVKSEFIDGVWELYEASAQISRQLPNGLEVSEIPDAVTDLTIIENDIFLIAAMACDTGEPDAFYKMLDDVDTEEERADLVTECYEMYVDGPYMHFFDYFTDDVMAVLDFYHCTYFQSWGNPFRPLERYYELHHYPVIEVW